MSVTIDDLGEPKGPCSHCEEAATTFCDHCDDVLCDDHVLLSRGEKPTEMPLLLCPHCGESPA